MCIMLSIAECLTELPSSAAAYADAYAFAEFRSEIRILGPSWAHLAILARI